MWDLTFNRINSRVLLPEDIWVKIIIKKKQLSSFEFHSSKQISFHIQWREINWQQLHEIMSILDEKACGCVIVVFRRARFGTPNTSGPCPTPPTRVHAGGCVTLRSWSYDPPVVITAHMEEGGHNLNFSSVFFWVKHAETGTSNSQKCRFLSISRFKKLYSTESCWANPKLG